MTRFKERLLNNWHLMRIMRLGIGTMLLVAGIQNKDWMIGLFSTFFLYQAITDTGCCSTAGYNTPGGRRKFTPPVSLEDTVEYEEVK